MRCIGSYHNYTVISNICQSRRLSFLIFSAFCTAQTSERKLNTSLLIGLTALFLCHYQKGTHLSEAVLDRRRGACILFIALLARRRSLLGGSEHHAHHIAFRKDRVARELDELCGVGYAPCLIAECLREQEHGGSAECTVANRLGRLGERGGDKANPYGICKV